MAILYIRDQYGNFVPIPVINGVDGKSAYEYAKDGGYIGTEEEFIALLNGLTGSTDARHYSDYSNPHKVTASQAGALSITGGTLTGKTLYFDNGNARLSGGEDYMQMDVFDSPKDDNNRRKLVLNGNNTSLNGAVVLTVRENGVDKTYTIYGGHNKPKASDVGAVAKTGDTMTGGLTIDKPSDWGQLVMHTPSGYYRCLETADDRVRIDVRDESLTTSRRYVDIFTNDGDSRHSHAFRFNQVTDGDTTTAYVLHTENINNFVVSKVEYTGDNSTQKTIPIRKTTQMVIVYGDSTTSKLPMTLGVLIRGMNAAHYDISPYNGGGSTTALDVTWTDTSVTVKLENASSNFSWNYPNTKYRCVLVG